MYICSYKPLKSIVNPWYHIAVLHNPTQSINLNQLYALWFPAVSYTMYKYIHYIYIRHIWYTLWYNYTHLYIYICAYIYIHVWYYIYLEYRHPVNTGIHVCTFGISATRGGNTICIAYLLPHSNRWSTHALSCLHVCFPLWGLFCQCWHQFSWSLFP